MVALRACCIVTFTIVLLASAATSTRAANLTLLTSSTAAAPLVITPLDAGQPLVVSVVNDTAVDPPTEFMSSWQFWLRVVADANTTGTVNPVSGIIPPNYVFAGVPSLGPVAAGLPGDPTTLNALDILFSLDSSAHIPTAPGANLQSILLAPSANALGRFGIYVADLHSLWVDSSNSGGLRTFTNVPHDDAMTRIGEVLVTSVADYDRNGIVEAADYVVWRDSLGKTGAGLAADGNGDQMITSLDYNVWQLHFGESALASGGASLNAAVPEPASLRLFSVTLVAFVLAANKKAGVPLVWNARP